MKLSTVTSSLIILASGSVFACTDNIVLAEPLADQWSLDRLETTCSNNGLLVEGHWRAYVDKYLPDNAHMDISVYSSSDELISEAKAELTEHRLFAGTRRRSLPRAAEFSVLIDQQFPEDSVVRVAYHTGVSELGSD